MRTSIWSQGWKLANQVAMDEGQEVEWNIFTSALSSTHIRLFDQEDELVWEFSPYGTYTPKLGYINLSIGQQLGKPL
jgi:hypothetical protein